MHGVDALNLLLKLAVLQFQVVLRQKRQVTHEIDQLDCEKFLQILLCSLDLSGVLLMLVVALLKCAADLLAKVLQVFSNLLDREAWPEVLSELIAYRVIKVVLLEAFRVRNELLTHELFEL